MDKEPDPIDVAYAASEKYAAIKEKHDFKLWEAWKENPSPETTRPLMQHFEPLFKNKAQAWRAPNVNEAAFRTDLKLRALKAFETYNPMRGTALRTHVENYLVKSHRYNVQQQNAMYIPEEKAILIGKIDSVSNELTEDLGRDPTHGEIADLLNERFTLRRPPTAKTIQQVQEARVRDVLSSNLESDPSPYTINRDREIVGLLRPTLSPDHQVVFDHLYGLNGKKQISSTNDLAAALGKTPPQISRIRTAILKKFDSYR